MSVGFTVSFKIFLKNFTKWEQECKPQISRKTKLKKGCLAIPILDLNEFYTYASSAKEIDQTN